MRVQVAAEAFNVSDDDDPSSGSKTHLALLALFYHGLSGRHRVLVEDQAVFEKWRNSLDKVAASGCDLALRASREAEVRSPARHEIRIVRSPSRWTVTPPEVSVTEACRVLDQPFALLVENSTNDTAFLLAVATSDQRHELERRRAEKWWEPKNGGGSTIAAAIDTLNRIPESRLLAWVLFDSDARQPGEPSKDARDLSRKCGTRIHHHRLHRRSVENYATRRALDWWASKGIDSAMSARIAAFYRLPQNCRHHFNMKHGLQGDAGAGIAPGLYDDLKDPDRMLLQRGFGRELRDVFLKTDLIRTAELIEDQSFDEVNEAVTTLLELMR